MTETIIGPATASVSTKASRRSDIQGLRAFAVLAVVLYHADFAIPGGFVGVDVFFVISGFVICAMLLRELDASGRIKLTTFYVRRFRRLFPALALVVSTTVVAATLLMSPLGSQQVTATTAFGAIFAFANIAIARTTGGYFDAPAAANPLLHTWSLSVEEQFYLVLPILLLVAWLIGSRVNRRRMAVVIALVAVGVVSLAIALALARGITIPRVPSALLGFYGPIPRAWEFVAGALLAVAVQNAKPLGRTLAIVLAALGAALLAVSLFAISETTAVPGPMILLPVTGTILLILAGLQPSNAISGILSARPLVALGNVSYSWYLWHWPFIVFAVLLWPGNPVAAPLAAAASLVPAFLSYRFVEQRYRAGGFADKRAFFSLVAVAAAVPLVLAGGLTVASGQNFWSPRIAMMQQSQELHAGYLAGCATIVPVTTATEDDCLWNADATGAPIYLIGDSIADHYSEGLIAASEELGRPLYMTTSSGCPAYAIEVTIPGLSEPIDATDKSACTPYIEETLAWLDDKPPGLVIMGANDVSWWSPSDEIDTTDKTTLGDLAAMQQVATADVAEKKRAITAGMMSTVQRLEKDGHQVVISQAAPSFRFPAPAWLPRECTVAVLLLDNCGSTLSVSEVDKVQAETRDAVVEVASRTSATVLDVRDYFCPDGICATSRDGIQLYRDDIHISVPASRDLAALFVTALKPLG